MLPEKPISLCRICLADEAEFPIFEGDDNIYQKLSTCLQEKLEDVDGYPRNICPKCNENLNIIYDFLNTYKESCKILQYGSLFVKEEKVFETDYNDADVMSNHGSHEPDEHVETKLESRSTHERKCFVDHVKPTKLRTKTKKLTKLIKPKKPKEPFGNKQNKKTNDIATCILEGNFVWNGEKWCSSKAVTKVKFTDPEMQRRQRRLQRDLQKQLRKKRLKEKCVSEKLCDLCGEVFKNRDRLLAHRNKVHFPKQLKCPQCPSVCKSAHYLNRHIKRKHSEKNYICAECGKEFAFLSEMNSHIKKIHKQEEFPKKVFACSICNKTYACQKSVTLHERSVHTGERPAVCSVCDSAFYHEEYLKEHMRLHTGETPFKCPVCSRGYAQRCNMKSHIKQHRISELNADLLSRIRPNYLRLMKP